MPCQGWNGSRGTWQAAAGCGWGLKGPSTWVLGPVWVGTTIPKIGKLFAALTQLVKSLFLPCTEYTECTEILSPMDTILKSPTLLMGKVHFSSRMDQKTLPTNGDVFSVHLVH